MHSFYSPEYDHLQKQIQLDKDESKHCVKVLRLKNGDKVMLQNGKGLTLIGKIINDDPKACLIEISKTEKEEKNANPIHVAIAPTKNTDRLEWFLEKATELAVDEITPIICRNSERKIVKHDRLEKVLVAAMKQSQRSFLPVLNDLSTFEEFISRYKNIEGKYIAHCLLSDEHIPHLQEMELGSNGSIVLIGPEGDFSNEEVELALSNGYKAVSLGKNRLRTETAGIAACHTLALSRSKKGI